MEGLRLGSPCISCFQPHSVVYTVHRKEQERDIYYSFIYIYYNYRILSTKFGKFYKEQKGQFIKTVRVKLVDYKTYKGRRDGIYIQIKEVSASESTLILQSKTLTLIDKITHSNLPDSIFYLDYRR